MPFYRLAIAWLGTCALVRPLVAQDGGRLVFQAESLAALGDAPRAFALAVQATNDAPSSARAWLARGLTASAQRPFPIARFGLVARKFNDWQREAVQSLTRATRLAPDSARYWVELGMAQSLTTDSTLRRMALESLTKGRDLAAALHDGPVASRASEAIGWWYWRRFERLLVYLPASPEAHNELRSGSPGDSARRDSLHNFLEWGHGWQGDYLEATEQFERAVLGDSANARARFDVLRSLVTFERWDDLLAVARQQVRDVSWDAWSWLALGLAQHRRGERNAAAAAFDSALVHLTASERDYLLDLSRVLAPDAAAAYRAQLPDVRTAFDRFYWLHTDPLWLEPGNLRWVEFLSRLTFAELRWGAPELGVRGLDTDPGRIYARFGPPSRITGADTSRLGVAHVTWAYRATLRFRFMSQPLLGAALLEPDSEALLRTHTEATPVSWSTATDDGYTVTDIAVQTAAFFPRRSEDATSDSLSVVVFAPNADGLVAEVAVFLADRAGRAERMPTTRTAVAQDSTWSAYEARAPGVSAYVRFEARDSARRVARRAAAEMAPLTQPLPHVSDIIVARCLTNRAQRPARWFDARIAYTPGPTCAPDRLALFWEEGTLDAGIDGGSVRITVRSSVADDVDALLRMAADPRAPSMELRALGSSEVAAQRDGVAQRGNREVSLVLPLTPVRARATLRYVELSFKAVKRSNFVVTLTRTLPGGSVVTRERRLPWN